MKKQVKVNNAKLRRKLNGIKTTKEFSGQSFRSTATDGERTAEVSGTLADPTKRWLDFPVEVRRRVMDMWHTWQHDSGTCPKCFKQYDDSLYYKLNHEEKAALSAATMQLSFQDYEMELRRIAGRPCLGFLSQDLDGTGEYPPCLAREAFVKRLSDEQFDYWWRTVDRGVFHQDKLCSNCLARWILLDGRC